MKKSVCFIVVFVVMLLKASVNALECQQGGRIVQGGDEVGLFINSECVDSSHICGRLDFRGTIDGESSKKIKFKVMLQNNVFHK